MTSSRASSSKQRQTVAKKTTGRREGLQVLLHIFTCANISLIVGVVDQVIDTLKAILDRIGIHNTKHYIAKELLTSQYGGSGATERLCVDCIFR